MQRVGIGAVSLAARRLIWNVLIVGNHAAIREPDILARHSLDNFQIDFRSGFQLGSVVVYPVQKHNVLPDFIDSYQACNDHLLRARRRLYGVLNDLEKDLGFLRRSIVGELVDCEQLSAALRFNVYDIAICQE